MKEIGFSLGAVRSLSLVLSHSEYQPQVLALVSGGGLLEDPDRKNMERRGGTALPRLLLVHGDRDDVFPVEDTKKLAVEWKRKGGVVDTEIVPGASHTLEPDKSAVFRIVGEYVKAHSTPGRPLPEFPSPPRYPFWVCELPAVCFLGVWAAKRRKNRIREGADGGWLVRSLAPPLGKLEIGLRVAAVVLGTIAVGDTALHLVTPRMEVSPRTLGLARKYASE